MTLPPSLPCVPSKRGRTRKKQSNTHTKHTEGIRASFPCRTTAAGEGSKESSRSSAPPAPHWGNRTLCAPRAPPTKQRTIDKKKADVAGREKGGGGGVGGTVDNARYTSIDSSHWLQRRVRTPGFRRPKRRFTRMTPASTHQPFFRCYVQHDTERDSTIGLILGASDSLLVHPAWMFTKGCTRVCRRSAYRALCS